MSLVCSAIGGDDSGDLGYRDAPSIEHTFPMWQCADGDTVVEVTVELGWVEEDKGYRASHIVGKVVDVNNPENKDSVVLTETEIRSILDTADELFR